MAAPRPDDEAAPPHAPPPRPSLRRPDSSVDLNRSIEHHTIPEIKSVGHAGQYWAPPTYTAKVGDAHPTR